jgi:hypothetical protein
VSTTTPIGLNHKTLFSAVTSSDSPKEANIPPINEKVIAIKTIAVTPFTSISLS